jgi:carbamoyl-phosphate synthase large subunit
VIKPSTGSGGSANISIALDKYDCELLVKLKLKYNIDIIAQQYVGSHLNEYTIGVSSNKFGEVLGSIILKRFITNTLSTSQKLTFNDNDYVISSGISQGYVCHNENLQKQAEKIAKLLKSTGPLNIQAREVNGKLLVFEINPRLSGTTSLRALAGYNEPYAMIKDQILGETWNISYNDQVILRTIDEIKID